jgi:heme-degrading monooxygenase HmoA
VNSLVESTGRRRLASWQRKCKGVIEEVLAMIVRMASVQVAPERIDKIVSRYRETVRPIHQQSKGLRNHYFLVDRHSGQLRIIGLWDSPEALEAALPRLEPARERLWEEFGEDPTLEAYEVADELRESRSAEAS